MAVLQLLMLKPCVICLKCSMYNSKMELVSVDVQVDLVKE